jgi:hypothetical protein
VAAYVVRQRGQFPRDVLQQINFSEQGKGSIVIEVPSI